MTIDDIKKKIQSSEFIETPDVTGLFRHVLNLYKNNRIINTSLQADGDMLLFQWGTYDWGKGRYFNIDITRQVMGVLEDPDEQSDSMQQLSVSLLFSPSTESETMSSGNKWCHTPDNLNDFTRFIENSKAYKWAVGKRPDAVEVELSNV